MEDINSLKEKVENGTASEDEILELAQLIDQVSAGHFKTAEDETLSDEQTREITGISKTILYKIRVKDGIYRRSIRRRRIGWLVSSIIVLIAAGVYFYAGPTETESASEIAVKAKSTVFKGKNHFRLADGTTVELNEGSELSYDGGYNTSERVVRLIGEGYFDVVHDPKRPFRVKSGEVTTTVLGTSFDIRAYPDQDEVTVTVIRGKVSVETNTGAEKNTILPNQQIVFNRTSKVIETSNLVVEKEIEWRRTILVLDGLSVEQAVTKIAERFNLKSDLQRCNAKDCRLELSFANHETADEMMKVIGHLMSVSYKISDGTISVTGGDPCPLPPSTP